MSTNGAIGVVVNSKIKAVYVHWDSYVAGVGKMLLENYDQELAEKLVAEGDISSLGADIGRKHPFDTYNLSDAEKSMFKNMTTFYKRDRDEEDVDTKTFNTAEEFLEYFSGEYWYLLGTDGEWYFSEGDMNWKRVDSVSGLTHD